MENISLQDIDRGQRNDGWSLLEFHVQVPRSATEADVSDSDEQKLTLFASSPETELEIPSQMYNLHILASWT